MSDQVRTKCVEYDFSRSVVLIVGGTSGIGRATAAAFGQAGARVVITGTEEGRAECVCGELMAVGIEADYQSVDVRDESSVKSAVDRTVARFGRLDIAVNNAGIAGDGASLDDARQDIWDDVMAVNARGVWLGLRYQIPAMLRTGKGAIVCASSVYGLRGRAAHHAYVASKHAVIGLTRSVALEYAARGIRVNALCAGATRTRAMRAVEKKVPDVVEALVAEHPIGRMADEDEIAAATLWLCSDAASYVTGCALSVDGGFLA